MTILITGGAGFIGANFILDWLSQPYAEPIINIDKLTYAGNLNNLVSLNGDARHTFVHGDINDKNLVDQLLLKYRPRAILNFAAESHVDRSIHGPEDFIQTNIVGSFHLLEATRQYWDKLPDKEKADFRFLHVSTDEVYGSLDKDDPSFTETHPYQPSSPYSASKAASNHIVSSYYKTYGIPILITNCSNNYGPFQFPEKLIPLIIHNALAGKSLPIYGDGQNVRDWLFVSDNCNAIQRVLSRGQIGKTYNIGGMSEKTNMEVVRAICFILDEIKPRADGISYESQINFVEDRLGHDKRYAININKIEKELGWRPKESFETGIRRTITWYLENDNWIQSLINGTYRSWIEKQYKTAA